MSMTVSPNQHGKQVPGGRNLKKTKPERNERMHRVIGAIIDKVEGYFLTHLFTAVECTSDTKTIDITEFSVSIDHEISVDDRCFDEAWDIVGKAIPADNKAAHDAHHDLDGLRTSIRWRSEQVGYYVGVFAGARLMGASRLDLEKLGEGLFRTLAQTEGVKNDETLKHQRKKSAGCSTRRRPRSGKN